MLQLSYIRENQADTIAGLQKKYVPEAEQRVTEILQLDQARRDTQRQLDETLAQSNELAKQIGLLMREGKKDQAEQAKTQTAHLKTTAKQLEERLGALEQQLHEVLVTLPNLPHPSVPQGRSADENEEVFNNQQPVELPDDALPHWDLIKKYDLIDFELGNKIAGAGFPVYKGRGARLQRALINFFLDEALAAGYFEIQPPILINSDSGFGTGQLPDKEGQMYHATADDLYLIPTAEVPITNIYRDVIVSEAALPIKNVGYTPCFRREAGSWGAHVRGLNRLHQFDKVEIVQIVKPENSYQTLDDMVGHVKNLLEKLELPYRILRLSSGDMSFASALTYDFEVYSGGQKRWLECSSVSNFETFQANRLKCRYKVGNKTQLLHTLNGSALALPRILAAMLENNQSHAGIRIPTALRPYCGFELID
jgi:seryl-tRNA synthetase